MRALGSLLRTLFTLASLLALVALILRSFFVDIVMVPHNGMAPTLIYGERVLVWRGAKADMGDVMVCEHPAQPEASVLGRTIAFAGHTVNSDEQGNLLVDTDRAGVQYEGELRFWDETRDKLFTMRHGLIDYRGQHRHSFFIEHGQEFSLRTYAVNRGIYLLGDNRSDLIDDSREFGEVDPAKCRGQVFIRLTPATPGPSAAPDDIHHSYLDVIR
jgi:signal peptidase I